MQSLESETINDEIERNFSELYESWENYHKNEISTSNIIKKLGNNIKIKIDSGLLEIKEYQICSYICDEMDKRNFPISFTDRTIQKHIQPEFKRTYTKKHDTSENGTNVRISTSLFRTQDSNLSELMNMDLDSLTNSHKQKIYEKINKIREKIEENADNRKIALFNRMNNLKDKDFNSKIIIPEKIPNILSNELNLWIEDLINFKHVVETLRFTYREEVEYSKGIKSMRLFLTSFNNEKYIRSVDEWVDILKLTETTTISGAAKISKVEGKVYDEKTDTYIPCGKTHSVGHDQLRKYINKPDYRKFEEIMSGLPFYKSLMKLHREHITPIRTGKEIIRSQTN